MDMTTAPLRWFALFVGVLSAVVMAGAGCDGRPSSKTTPRWAPSPSVAVVQIAYSVPNPMPGYRGGPGMSLWGDGRIFWSTDGKVLEGHLSPEEMTNVLRRIQREGFFDMDPHYSVGQMADAGTYEMTVTTYAGTKTVSAYGAWPSDFKECAQFLLAGAGAVGRPYTLGELVPY